MAVYLAYANPPLEHVLQDVRSNLLLAIWSFWMLGSFFRPKAASRSLKYPAPRWSGAFVVVATGVAGAIFVARSSISTSYVAASAIMVGTLVSAALVWRFATVHAGEIGEARFVNNAR
ncbi:hypothetical protein U1839_25240 [Sphingomonas sp. RT2P30]|uniref:hypothetical protein n=1 Tax=Parasphingomonas halimpatiens TaxID=3096162 RepID=UPI002FCC0E4B